jgi:hypothetical protein
MHAHWPKHFFNYSYHETQTGNLTFKRNTPLQIITYLVFLNFLVESHLHVS